MKKLVTIIIVVWCVTISATNISISGSTTVAPIMHKAARAFMDENPEIIISVIETGSEAGISQLNSHNCDIAAASRKIKQKEKASAKAKNIELVEYAIAKDGIVVAVNPDNNLQNISLKQIQMIYSGEINSWSDINKSSQKIIPISRDFSSGTFSVFKKLVMQNKEISPDIITVASNSMLASVVSEMENSIGYIGMGFVNESLKIVSVDSIYPTEKTIRNGSYPLARTLYLYTNKENKDVKKFIDYVLSDSGKKYVKLSGFITIK